MATGDETKDALSRMVEALDHRGPDAVGFDEPELDERSYSRLLAAQIGSDHREDLFTAPTPALMESFADVYDEPFGDSSALPTMSVSELARESVTVALSGDGVDEVLGGYERYSRELLKGTLRSAAPSALLPALKRHPGIVVLKPEERLEEIVSTNVTWQRGLREAEFDLAQ